MELLVDAKVGMDAELSAAPRLVEAAADEIRIRDQALDGREPFEKLEHRLRVEEVEQLANRSAALLGKDLPLVKARVAHVEDPVRAECVRRKVVEGQAGDSFWQEVVEDGVRKRRREAVLRRIRLAGVARFLAVEEKSVRAVDWQNRADRG